MVSIDRSWICSWLTSLPRSLPAAATLLQRRPRANLLLEPVLRLLVLPHQDGARDAAALEVVADRDSVAEVAPDDQLVVLRAVAEDLDRAPEDLAEEGRDRVVAAVLAGEDLAQLGAAVVRVRPVLDAAAAAEDRVVIVGHVADGVDPGDGRLEALVDDDPVVDLRACALGELRPRHDADPYHHEPRPQLAPALRDRALDVPVAAKLRDRVAEQDLDALLAVELDARVRQLAAAELREQHVERLDDRRLEPERGERRRDLHPDEAGAHRHGGVLVARGVADLARVGQRAQDEDALAVGAGDGQAARLRTGGEHEPEEGQPPAG